MRPCVFAHAVRRGQHVVCALRRRLAAATKPVGPRLLLDTLADLPRSKPPLIAANALVRQHLLILRRSVTRPRWTPADRALLVLLASRVRAWRHALRVVQPDTILRWHRAALRLWWRHKSRSTARTPTPTSAADTSALIQEMAASKRLWGAQRIRGELLKLDRRVATTRVQRYMRQARPPRRSGQSGATFLHTHAPDIGACAFLPVTDLLFGPLYAFVSVALATRRLVHVGVRRHPPATGGAQHLRAATAQGQRPPHLICDHDSRSGPAFVRVAAVSGIDLVRTA